MSVSFSFLLLSLFSPSLSSLALERCHYDKMSLSSYHNSVSSVQLQLLVQSLPVLHMRLASLKIAINSQAKKRRESHPQHSLSLSLSYFYISMYYSIPVAVVYTLKDLLYAWAGVFLRIKLSGHNIIKQLSTSYPMERERERERRVE